MPSTTPVGRSASQAHMSSACRYFNTSWPVIMPGFVDSYGANGEYRTLNTSAPSSQQLNGPAEQNVTSSYERLLRLPAPWAERVVLAHPKKLRVIAEGIRKGDKLDAQVLAGFLGCHAIPGKPKKSARRGGPGLREPSNGGIGR